VFTVKTEYVMSYGRPGQAEGPDGLSFPIGVSVNGEGKVVICDTRRNLVKVFDSNGKVCGIIKSAVRPFYSNSFFKTTCTH